MKFIKKENSNVSPAFVNECSKKFNITPCIMEQIIVRGNDTFEKISEYISPTQNSFHDPFKLKGMKELIERIYKAKEKKERVLIFGDYDVDGVSATAIMLKTLRILGLNSKYYLPNRYVDGYGLTNDVIDKIKKEYNPNLIITVDCGISCYNEVEYAKSLGIEIVITDHHEIPENIPNTIVVNAKIKDQEYEFSGLCGTGLAYKISQALIGEKSSEMLPIACIATIADIVPLIDENRAIVHFGLKVLTQLPIGLKMLFKTLGVNIHKCASNEVSFKIAPKLNASGRMGDAKDSLKLFLTNNLVEIKALIKKINSHNDNRKDLCNMVEKDCLDILNNINISAPSIILSSKDWDQGILGIICAKLVGLYNRPVFLFSENNGELIGSARSIPGINIHKLLESMNDILESFGGHPLAAGLTIKTENFDKFIYRVNDFLLKNCDSEVFIPKEYYDIEVELNDLTQKFLKDLRIIEPTGCENEVLRLYLKTQKFAFAPMKNYHQHCNIKVESRIALVSFNCSNLYSKMKSANSINVIFEVQADSYNKSIRGIVKALDCDIQSIKNLSRMDVLPPLEQLKYLCKDNKAIYTMYNISKENLNAENCFGTAFVVNSEAGYNKFLELANLSKIIKYDIYNGTENSGLNTLFLYPQSINFTRGFSKIIFLEPVADLSYIAEINKISNAKIFIPNQNFNGYYFKNINTKRENFGLIYKDLEHSLGKYHSLNDIYLNIKKRKEVKYNYKDFYTAFLVFLELKIFSFEKYEDAYLLKLSKNVKSDLNSSKIYKSVQYFKKGE